MDSFVAPTELLECIDIKKEQWPQIEAYLVKPERINSILSGMDVLEAAKINFPTNKGANSLYQALHQAMESVVTHLNDDITHQGHITSAHIESAVKFATREDPSHATYRDANSKDLTFTDLLKSIVENAVTTAPCLTVEQASLAGVVAEPVIQRS